MGAPKANQNAGKHKIWSLVAAMRGTRVLDGRSVQAQTLKKTMIALSVSHGCSSWDELSPQNQILVRRMAFKDLICSAVEDEALENGKQVAEGLWDAYLSWSNSLRADLLAFGLERVPRDVGHTLEDVRQALQEPTP